MRAKREKRRKLPVGRVNDVVSAAECTGLAQFSQGCEAEEESLRAIYDIPHAGDGESGERRD